MSAEVMAPPAEEPIPMSEETKTAVHLLALRLSRRSRELLDLQGELAGSEDPDERLRFQEVSSECDGVQYAVEVLLSAIAKSDQLEQDVGGMP